MAAPALDIQAQLIAEVGDPNGTLIAVIDALWAAYADKGTVDPRLQALYTKRALLDIRLAEEQPSIDFRRGGDIDNSEGQRFTHLQQMRTNTQAELVRLETIRQATRVPRTGALTTVSPLSPLFPDAPNATDPVYSGSPYGRRPNW